MTGGRCRERVPVDEAHTLLDRIDSQGGPCRVEERQRRQHPEIDVVALSQIANRTLQHERRSGNGVEGLPVPLSRADHGLCDPAVHQIEIVTGVVEIVERLAAFDQRRGGVASRANEERVRHRRFDRGSGLFGDEVDSARTEAAHRHDGSHQPGGMT